MHEKTCFFLSQAPQNPNGGRRTALQTYVEKRTISYTIIELQNVRAHTQTHHQS